MTQASNLIAEYISHGWELVPIAPGTKGPKGPETVGWNLKANCIKSAADLPPGYGVGLAHAYSGTMALDIDSPAAFEMLAAAGIDLQALLDAPDAVQITSGRPGRHKLIYRLPVPGMTPQTEQVKHDGKMAYELRCATANGLTVQDVLPPTIHPDTGKPYEFAGRGHWQNVPVIPPEVMNHWLDRIAQKASKPSNSASESRCTDAEFERVKSAVYAINPSCSRVDWVAVGMVLHSTGHPDAFEVWNQWSALSDKYEPGKMAGQWSSFSTDKPGAAVKLGTLYRLAAANGWTPPQPDASGLFSAVTTAPAATDHAADTPDAGFAEVSITDVLTNPQPPHRFIVGQLVPTAALTLLSGNGGSGKSTLTLELALHVAMGKPFLGMQVERVNVMVLSAEDSGGTLRRRIAQLCQRHSIDPAELAQRLTVLDATADPLLWAAIGRHDAGPTAAYARLTQRCTAGNVGLLILDNASDTFAGDSFNKSSVTRFIRALTRCVHATDGAVILLAHVNRATAAGGANSTGTFSDSVAWHNAARSRLFLDDTSEPLALIHEKSNYGVRAQPLRITRHPLGGFELMTARAKADGLPADILKFIKALTDDGGWIGTSMNGTTSNNINRKMYRDHHAYPDALRGGTRNSEANSTVQELLNNGFLVQEERWPGNADAKAKRNNSKPRGLWLTKEGLNFLETGEIPPPKIDFPNLSEGGSI